MAQQYTVKAGDTLFSIAQQFYKDGNLWGKISTANHNLNPNSLQPGTVLQIPD
ncbi:LysM peptidoglycan-binding domain-containing protein [Nostoc sp. DSM 114167]|jgi:nucleoid-associated protein YgaU|uniref:LysM peptidoglycan-binding domain-containing protein n=1 Tax=Nostoc sp. DSM 114167 TaxID=3439050 RepID=UPI004045EB2E